MTAEAFHRVAIIHLSWLTEGITKLNNTNVKMQIHPALKSLQVFTF